MSESFKKVRSRGFSTILSQMIRVERDEALYRRLKRLSLTDSSLRLPNQQSVAWSFAGVAERSSVVMELSVNRVIEVDVKSHQLLRVNEEEVSGIQHNQVLDLNDDGERWEGDVLRDQPYGWGVLYDSENRRSYEGFRLKDVNVCYGTQYYSDIQKVEYKGEWFKGKRWGRGIQYDRNGKTMHDGTWMNDTHNEKMTKGLLTDQFIYTSIEELTVAYKSCNGDEWQVLDFVLFPRLRVVFIGDWCFGRVKQVRMVGMKHLAKVVIGNHCFRYKDDPSNTVIHRFILKDCERLERVRMGYESFGFYSSCEMENLESLEVFDMGDRSVTNCSFYCASLTMKSDSQNKK